MSTEEENSEKLLSLLKDALRNEIKNEVKIEYEKNNYSNLSSNELFVVFARQYEGFTNIMEPSICIDVMFKLNKREFKTTIYIKKRSIILDLDTAYENAQIQIKKFVSESITDCLLLGISQFQGI